MEYGRLSKEEIITVYEEILEKKKVIDDNKAVIQKALGNFVINGSQIGSDIYNNKATFSFKNYNGPDIDLPTDNEEYTKIINIIEEDIALIEDLIDQVEKLIYVIDVFGDFDDAEIKDINVKLKDMLTELNEMRDERLDLKNNIGSIGSRVDEMNMTKSSAIGAMGAATGLGGGGSYGGGGGGGSFGGGGGSSGGSYGGGTGGYNPGNGSQDVRIPTTTTSGGGSRFDQLTDLSGIQKATENLKNTESNVGNALSNIVLNGDAVGSGVYDTKANSTGSSDNVDFNFGELQVSIEMVNNDIQETESLISDIETRISENEAYIAENEAQIATNEAEIASNEAEIANYQAQIQELEASKPTGDDEESAATRAAIDAQIAELSSKIAELETRNAELEAENQRMENENSQLEQINADLGNQQAELEEKKAEKEGVQEELNNIQDAYYQAYGNLVDAYTAYDLLNEAGKTGGTNMYGVEMTQEQSNQMFANMQSKLESGGEALSSSLGTNGAGGADSLGLLVGGCASLAGSATPNNIGMSGDVSTPGTGDSALDNGKTGSDFGSSTDTGTQSGERATTDGDNDSQSDDGKNSEDENKEDSGESGDPILPGAGKDEPATGFDNNGQEENKEPNDALSGIDMGKYDGLFSSGATSLTGIVEKAEEAATANAATSTAGTKPPSDPQAIMAALRKAGCEVFDDGKFIYFNSKNVSGAMPIDSAGDTNILFGWAGAGADWTQDGRNQMASQIMQSTDDTMALLSRSCEDSTSALAVLNEVVNGTNITPAEVICLGNSNGVYPAIDVAYDISRTYPDAKIIAGGLDSSPQISPELYNRYLQKVNAMKGNKNVSYFFTTTNGSTLAYRCPEIVNSGNNYVFIDWHDNADGRTTNTHAGDLQLLPKYAQALTNGGNGQELFSNFNFNKAYVYNEGKLAEYNSPTQALGTFGSQNGATLNNAPSSSQKNTPTSNRTTPTNANYKINLGAFAENPEGGFELHIDKSRFNLEDFNNSVLRHQYGYTDKEAYEAFVAVVIAESDKTIDDALGVASVALNRCDRPNYANSRTNGTNPFDQMFANGGQQYETITDTDSQGLRLYEKYMPSVVGIDRVNAELAKYGTNYETLLAVVSTATEDGLRNNDYTGFEANGWDGYYDPINHISRNGNRYNYAGDGSGRGIANTRSSQRQTVSTKGTIYEGKDTIRVEPGADIKSI